LSQPLKLSTSVKVIIKLQVVHYHGPRNLIHRIKPRYITGAFFKTCQNSWECRERFSEICGSFTGHIPLLYQCKLIKNTFYPHNVTNLHYINHSNICSIFLHIYQLISNCSPWLINKAAAVRKLIISDCWKLENIH